MATQSRILVDAANSPINGISDVLWIGANIIGNPSGQDFIQVGYQVSGGAFTFFTYTNDTLHARTCLAGSVWWTASDGTPLGCGGSLSSIGLSTGNTYEFTINMCQGGVYLGINGTSILEIDDPAPNGLTWGYDAAELASPTGGPSFQAAQTSVVKGNYPSLQWYSLQSNTWVDVSHMYANDWLAAAGQPTQLGNVACPPWYQAAGIFSVSDWSVAGNYSGACYSYGAQMD